IGRRRVGRPERRRRRRDRLCLHCKCDEKAETGHQRSTCHGSPHRPLLQWPGCLLKNTGASVTPLESSWSAHTEALFPVSLDRFESQIPGTVTCETSAPVG